MLPDTLPVALKEWQAVCDALAAGRQIILLRKGGIYESAGEFEIEHRRFLLFPTYVHQNAAMLKAPAQAAEVSAEPSRVTLSLAGEITDIVQVADRRVMDRLDDQHIWAKPLIDMRFNYRPENPLYLLLVRAYRLREAVTIDNTPAYAGCKSWVPLEQPAAIQDAAAVLSDAEYQTRRQAILAHASGHPQRST
ncbi:MAG: DUF1802 family protein [Tepidisphaeraceae bacterium]|jgi:hypothetical protein